MIEPPSPPAAQQVVIAVWCRPWKRIETSALLHAASDADSRAQIDSSLHASSVKTQGQFGQLRSTRFDELYAAKGRPSIAPEKILRAPLL